MSRRHCEICNVPTDGLWLDRPLCDACLDEMADEMTGSYTVAGPEQVARYIAEAREKAAEAYSDRMSENWRQW